MSDYIKKLDYTAVEQRILAYMAEQPTHRYGGRCFEQQVDAAKVLGDYRARFKNIAHRWEKSE